MQTPAQRTKSLNVLTREVHACRACPRLVEWREQVAVDKRAAYRDDDYWGKAISGFGDAAAQIVILGLAPAAHGANRTGRMFTGDRSGDWLFRSMHTAGLANKAESTYSAAQSYATSSFYSRYSRCVRAPCGVGASAACRSCWTGSHRTFQD